MAVLLHSMPLTSSNLRPIALARQSEDPSLGSVFATQPLERFDMGQAVFWEGDAAEHVFQVTEGVLRLIRILPDGRRGVTGFIYPGDVLGAGFQDRYLCTAETVTPVELRRRSRRQFQSLVSEHSALGRELYALMCAELSAAQDQMLLLGRKTAQERVASFLLLVARKFPRRAEGRSLALPMTRQDIADHLGLTIETVSRTVTKLRKSGAIALLDAQRVLLRDLAALARLAGEGDGRELRRAASPP